MANKMTQKDYFNEIIKLAETNGRDDLVKFAENRIESLNRKTVNKKATKTQEENVGFKAIIKEVLTANDKAMTVTEIQDQDETLKGLSNQRVSALLRQMKDTGEVEKTTDKKKSYFALVK